jgi:hypothetical protein
LKNKKSEKSKKYIISLKMSEKNPIVPVPVPVPIQESSSKECVESSSKECVESSSKECVERKTKYRFLCENEKLLEKSVNELIEKGYKPFGEKTTNRMNSLGLYCKAMIKKE